MSETTEPSSPVSSEIIDSLDGHNDPYERAVQLVLENRQASVALLQRQLKLGHGAAVKLMVRMEKAGLVSSYFEADGLRKILLTDDQRKALLIELGVTRGRPRD